MNKQEAMLNMEGVAIAQDLAITFNGIQYDAKDEPAGFMFTDPDTGSSFMAHDALDAQIRLNQVRESYSQDVSHILPEMLC